MKIRQAIDIFALIFGFFYFQSFRAGAAESSGTAAAPKEGKLVIYSSTDSASVEPLLQDFKSLYPFLQVEYNDLNTTEVYNRFIAETASGSSKRISCGARRWICSSSLPVKAMRDLCVAGNLRPAKVGGVAEPGLRHDLRAGEHRLQQAAVARGCRAAKSRGPDSPDKGKAGCVQGKNRHLRSGKKRRRIFDDDARCESVPAVLGFGQSVGISGAKVYTSTGAMLEKVGSGEHYLAYNIIGSYVLLRQKKDPSMGLVLPKDYTLVFSRVAFISKTARNPNAAKLFLDYILSKRGQTVMSEKSLVYSLRSDVPGNITAAGLTKDLGKALKPINVNTDILAGLEQNKRLEFMKQWQAALKR